MSSHSSFSFDSAFSGIGAETSIMISNRVFSFFSSISVWFPIFCARFFTVMLQLQLTQPQLPWPSYSVGTWRPRSPTGRLSELLRSYQLMGLFSIPYSWVAGNPLLMSNWSRPNSFRLRFFELRVDKNRHVSYLMGYCRSRRIFAVSCTWLDESDTPFPDLTNLTGE